MGADQSRLSTESSAAPAGAPDSPATAVCFDWIQYSEVSAQEFLQEDLSDGVVLRAKGRPGMALCTTRRRLYELLGSGETLFYACRPNREWDAVEGRVYRDTLYVRLQMPEFNVIVNARELGAALRDRSLVWDVEESDVVLPTTGSVSAMDGLQYFSADHCQEGTHKVVWTLLPRPSPEVPRGIDLYAPPHGPSPLPPAASLDEAGLVPTPRLRFKTTADIDLSGYLVAVEKSEGEYRVLNVRQHDPAQRRMLRVPIVRASGGGGGESLPFIQDPDGVLTAQVSRQQEPRLRAWLEARLAAPPLHEDDDGDDDALVLKGLPATVTIATATVKSVWSAPIIRVNLASGAKMFVGKRGKVELLEGALSTAASPLARDGSDMAAVLRSWLDGVFVAHPEKRYMRLSAATLTLDMSRIVRVVAAPGSTRPQGVVLDNGLTLYTLGSSFDFDSSALGFAIRSGSDAAAVKRALALLLEQGRSQQAPPPVLQRRVERAKLVWGVEAYDVLRPERLTAAEGAIPAGWWKLVPSEGHGRAVLYASEDATEVCDACGVLRARPSVEEARVLLDFLRTAPREPLRVTFRDASLRLDARDVLSVRARKPGAVKVFYTTLRDFAGVREELSWFEVDRVVYVDNDAGTVQYSFEDSSSSLIGDIVAFVKELSEQPLKFVTELQGRVSVDTSDIVRVQAVQNGHRLTWSWGMEATLTRGVLREVDGLFTVGLTQDKAVLRAMNRFIEAALRSGRYTA